MMYNIEKEIEEILNKELFLAFQEHKGHILNEHVLSDKDLKEKLWNMPRPMDEDDIVMATRFFNEESALYFIYKSLKKNEDKIREWRKTLDYPCLEIKESFDEEVGEGICKNTDKRLIKVHGINIILIMNDFEGRAFYIKTAYPIRTIDDNDNIYDAIDEYIQQKTKTN